MAEEQTVTLVAFNAGQQMAVDSDDRIWIVDAWYDNCDEELTERFADPDRLVSDTRNNVNWDNWEFVEYVTAYSDFPEGRKWTSFRPDDFEGGPNG